MSEPADIREALRKLTSSNAAVSTSRASLERMKKQHERVQRMHGDLVEDLIRAVDAIVPHDRDSALCIVVDDYVVTRNAGEMNLDVRQIDVRV